MRPEPICVGPPREYLELYNEMDIHAGAGAADQYMSVVQAAAYGMAQGDAAQSTRQTRLLCGVITDSVHDGFRQVCNEARCARRFLVSHDRVDV